MISPVTNSTAQQLYSTAQTAPNKTAHASKPAKPANEEVTESGAERATEMGKGEEIDAYA